jgi:hypothetical protein
MAALRVLACVALSCVLAAVSAARQRHTPLLVWSGASTRLPQGEGHPLDRASSVADAFTLTAIFPGVRFASATLRSRAQLASVDAYECARWAADDPLSTVTTHWRLQRRAAPAAAEGARRGPMTTSVH